MRKPRLPLWALAWLAIVLAAAVVFLANQAAVDRLLAVTGLETVLYPHGKYPPSPTPAPTPLVAELPSPSPLPEPTPDTAEPTATPEPEPVVAAPETPLPATPNTYRLYFLKLSPEGRMEPSSFARELPAGSTPLSATLKALLLGPTLQDKAQGALSMIPDGTKLLSVRLHDRTALISFSPEFEHNASGLEGLAGQVRQVVWTATQFSSVDAVQILINGQYRDTLDGLPVAAPLTRASLP
jgi:spore germination protein GerM